MNKLSIIKKSICESRILPAMLTVLLSFLFIVVFYSEVIFHPNKYLFNDTGDAIKNYFVYAAQVEQESFFQTELMNYPYGENSFFLDCHPGLTILLKILSKIFPSISMYSIGIINFLMIFSIVITSFFIYFILLEYKINRYYSAVCGFGIAILAPQIFRITGHLALSYSFAIPVVWYLFLRFYRSQKYKVGWSVLVGISNLFFFFIHAYLGMITLIFSVTLYFFYYVFNLRKLPFSAKNILYISCQIIIPTVLYYLFVVITDHHLGRTANPWGFFVYKASFQTVFLPTHPPVRLLLDKLITIKSQVWEGWAYIGLFSVIILVYCIIRLLINRRYLKPFWKLNPGLKIAFFSGIIILLFSMAYPFKIGLHFLLDWFPMLNTFRSLGRFAWVFYYTTTVFSVCFLVYLFHNSKYKKWFVVILMLLPISFFVEGVPHQKTMSKEIKYVQNPFIKGNPPEEYTELLKIVDNEKYQAVIPLPFFHEISENYDKSATPKIIKGVMTLSYHSKLPSMSNFSGRASIIESKDIFQSLLSPGFYPRNIDTIIHDDRPFLILYSNEDLTSAEQAILDKSSKIFSSEEFSLYEISKSKLFENTSSEEFELFYAIKDSLILQNDFLCSDSNTVVFYKTFDEMNSERFYRGEGALQINKKGYHTLCEIEANFLQKDQKYIVSFWINNEWKNFGQDYLRSNLIVEEVDKNDDVQWLTNTDPIHSKIFNDSWTMVELEFEPKNIDNKIKIFISGGSKPRKAQYFIDDVLVYKKGTLIYKEIYTGNSEQVELFKNNHKILLSK